MWCKANPNTNSAPEHTVAAGAVHTSNSSNSLSNVMASAGDTSGKEQIARLERDVCATGWWPYDVLSALVVAAATTVNLMLLITLHRNC